MVRHIIDDLENSSDDFDEEQIKDIRLMLFCGSNFELAFFEGTILKMEAILKIDFLKERF